MPSPRNMPAELPGLYWDEARNRYFPISSKPKQQNPPSTTAKGSHQSIRRRRSHTLSSWRTNDIVRGTWNYCLRERLSHELLSLQYATTSWLNHTHVPTLGRIKSFSTANFLNDENKRLIGDDQGWLYSYREESSQNWNELNAELNLHALSEVSSISISGPLCVATCLGPFAKVAVQDLTASGGAYILNFNGTHDIWASHLQGRRLVLGANQKALYLSDVDSNQAPQFLNTNSDVFAVFLQDNLIYTGARNGTIQRFDIRLGKQRGQKLFESRFFDAPRSSVLHLEPIRDSQLFVSQMNGDLACFDLRFPGLSSNPVVQYKGHVNSYTQRLGIAFDHTEGFVFAAGQDCRIRGWSLHNGVPITSTLPDPTVNAIVNIPMSAVHRAETNVEGNPFFTTFPHPVETMEVSTEAGVSSLWAACDHELFQYHLGKRWIPVVR